MKNVISGDIFIIPNACAKVSEFPSSAKEGMIKNLKRFGFSIDDNTILVQVWATGPEVDNWSCHGWLPEFMTEEEINIIGKDISVKKFPAYLPVSFFKGMKEGQSVIIRIKPDEQFKKGLLISLKLNQLEYRYGNLGPFEKVLQRKLDEMQAERELSNSVI
jgi:hypothetical protein